MIQGAFLNIFFELQLLSNQTWPIDRDKKGQ